MTKDEIIEMAREAGLRDCTCDGTKGCLERFAALVAEKEREACAKACEDDAFVEQWKGLAEAAKRIRARKP